MRYSVRHATSPLRRLPCCTSARLPSPGTAERLGYPASEFTARRKALGQALGSGTVLLFGSTMPLNGIRFRQDNDFYYLTGNEDVNAVLVMDAATADAWLFLPAQGAGEIRSDGKNWLSQGDQAKARGFAGDPAAHRADASSSRAAAAGSAASRSLWTRLSEARRSGRQPRRTRRSSLARRLQQPARRVSRARTAGGPRRCAQRYPVLRPQGRRRLRSTSCA